MVPAGERRYIASLTGLRGVAALGVLLFHYGVLHPGLRLDQAVPFIGEVLQFPFGFGFSGVDVFFVLSGFLLSLPFARAALESGNRPPLGRYFQRRFLRVFPAYYAQLFIILLVGSWFLTWRSLDTGGLLAHLVMFLNIGPHPVTPVVGVWWTLPVEMGFYLLLPFLAPFMRPWRWLPLLVLGIALSFAYRYWAAGHYGHLGGERVFLAASQLPGYLAEFMLGATAALLVQRRNLRGDKPPAPVMLDAMFVFGLLGAATWMYFVIPSAGADYWLGHWGMIVAPFCVGLPLSVAVVGLYWGSRLGKLLLANRLMYFIGLVSYSLYLWHFVVMQQIGRIGGETYAGLSHWLTFPLALASSLATAAASYYLFERPFYRLKTYRQLKGG